MINPQIVFIDSTVNVKFVNKLLSRNQKLKGILKVHNNNIIVSNGENIVNNLTHATLCAKCFLDKFHDFCDIYFIEILKDSGFATNISSLLIALQWCLENDINVINLSIGTTSIIDMSLLYEKVNGLIAKGVIIVSASSNSGKMTFPAYFPDVIGVKAIQNKLRKGSYEYNDNIEGIEISCYLDEEMIRYNKKYYCIPCANSLAAPVISAEICKMINKGHDKLPMIKKLLKEKAITVNKQKQISGKFFEKDITVPILLICNGDKVNDLVQELLTKFEKNGYSGICLSEIYKTDFERKILGISEFYLYSINEILYFYCNYCNVDYIILHIKNNYSLVKDVDVIINTSDNINNNYDKEIKIINVKDYKNSDEFFGDIYDYLLYGE